MALFLRCYSHVPTAFAPPVPAGPSATFPSAPIRCSQLAGFVLFSPFHLPCRTETCWRSLHPRNAHRTDHGNSPGNPSSWSQGELSQDTTRVGSPSARGWPAQRRECGRLQCRDSYSVCVERLRRPAMYLARAENYRTGRSCRTPAACSRSRASNPGSTAPSMALLSVRCIDALQTRKPVALDARDFYLINEDATT